MEKEQRPSRQKNVVQPPPQPQNVELFQFLVRLFEDDDEKPQLIELCQAFGPGMRQIGQKVESKPFKINEPKPTQEKLVELSNMFLDLAQQNCNAVGRPHSYVIGAKHYAKSESYYKNHLLKMQPKQIASGEYDPHATFGDDDIPGDPKRRDELLSQTLAFMREMHEQRKWEMEQNTVIFRTALERSDGENNRLSTRVRDLEADKFTWVKTTEEMLSRKQERDMAMESHKFKIEGMKFAANYITQLIPVVVKQLKPTDAPPFSTGQQSSESMALDAFFNSLTEEQFKTVLGDLDANKQLAGGILTSNQSAILTGISSCSLPPTELAKVSPGGEFTITQDQFFKIQEIVGMDKLLPLAPFFQERTAT